MNSIMALTERSRLAVEEIVRREIADLSFDNFKNTEAYRQLMKPVGNKLLGSFAGDTGDNPNLGYHKKAKDLFGGEGTDQGFDSLGDVLLGIKNNDYKITGKLDKDMDTIEGAGGGFLLPSAFSNKIIDLMLEQEICRPRCKVYSLGKGKGKSLTIPAVDDYDHSSNVGGIVTYWKAENTAYTESDVVIRQISMTANKLTVLCDLTEELLHDSAVATQDLVGGIFAKALGFEVDNCILSDAGTGAGKLLSISNSNAVVTVTKETEQDADTLVLANVEKIISRISPFSFPKSTWLTSLTCLPSLMHLNRPVGTSAAMYNPFNEANNIWKLYGRQLLFSEHMPVIGDSGTLQLIDFSRYAILLLQDITVKSDSSLGFKSDRVSFKASIRIDGQPLDKDVLTPKRGDTVGSFVKLGTV